MYWDADDWKFRSHVWPNTPEFHTRYSSDLCDFRSYECELCNLCHHATVPGCLCAICFGGMTVYGTYSSCAFPERLEGCACFKVLVKL